MELENSWSVDEWLYAFTHPLWFNNKNISFMYEPFAGTKYLPSKSCQQHRCSRWFQSNFHLRVYYYMCGYFTNGTISRLSWRRGNSQFAEVKAPRHQSGIACSSCTMDVRSPHCYISWQSRTRIHHLLSSITIRSVLDRSLLPSQNH